MHTGETEKGECESPASREQTQAREDEERRLANRAAYQAQLAQEYSETPVQDYLVNVMASLYAGTRAARADAAATPPV